MGSYEQLLAICAEISMIWWPTAPCPSWLCSRDRRSDANSSILIKRGL